MEWLRLIVGGLLLIVGMCIFTVEIFGVFRFKFSLNRMHAAAMGDTLGITVSLLGLMIISGFNYTTLKMALIVVFLWCSSPVSSHLLARLEVMTNGKIEKHAEIFYSVEELENSTEETITDYREMEED
jgi:multicomponent Na+:H+ antiporter subunit G